MMGGFSKILLVEDNSIDAMALKRSIKKIDDTLDVIHVTNGQEALDYIEDQKNLKPNLIFLDLNMPVMDGHEFLSVKNGDDCTKDIPVVILTTSRYHSDISKSFQNGVAGYFVKSMDLEESAETLRSIITYWKRSETTAS